MRNALLCGTALLLAACGGSDDAATDSAGATAAAVAAPTPAAPTLSLASMTGRWNVRAVPDAGTDTTPTMVVLDAAADSTAWTMTFPGGKPIPARIVAVGGDSVVTEAGPYESTRRKGLQVTTRSTFRMQGDRTVGRTTATYRVGGRDSTATFRTEGTRAP